MPSNCVNKELFERLITSFDKSIEIEKQGEPDVRFSVWDTTVELVKEVLLKRSSSSIDMTSVRIKNKMQRSLRDIHVKKSNRKNVQYFLDEVVDSDFNKEMLIALQEVIASTEGEFNKVDNNLLDVKEVTSNGKTPNLSLARLSAQVGRKIAYQKNYRFSNAADSQLETKEEKENAVYATPAVIESMYASIGYAALTMLKDKGYVELENNNGRVVKDYTIKGEDPYVKLGEIDNDSGVVTLKPELLGGNEAVTLLQGEEVKKSTDTLKTVLKYLNVANSMLVPVKFKAPSNESTEYKEMLNESDYTPSSTLEKAMEVLNEKPLKIKEEFRGLFESLHTAVKEDIRNGTDIVSSMLLNNKILLKSLFGLKDSYKYSVDKKDSISGKNLSKTAPFDDLAEYWDLLDPDNIHLSTKAGRNARLYYLESILNPHTSKYARDMLSSGEQNIKVDNGKGEFTEAFKRLTATVADKLDVSPEEVLGVSPDKVKKERMNSTLDYFDKYKNSNNLKDRMAALSNLVRTFEGVNFATLLSGLEAVTNIRNRESDTVTTSFNIDTDVTASGGTIMFTMASGNDANVEQLLVDLDFIKGKKSRKLDDIYNITSKEIKNFIENKEDEGDIYNPTDKDVEEETTGKRVLLKSIFENLYKGELRDFSKNPSMVLIYRQGRNSANLSISKKITDKIFDNLNDKDVRNLVAEVLEDDSYRSKSFKDIRKEKGLYKRVHKAVREKEVGFTLYDLMDKAIIKKYLSSYIKESNDIWALVEESGVGNNFKVLPAMAVKDGIEATFENIEGKNLGVPLSKLFSVKHTVGNTEVLTRENKLQQSVMDVSQIHGFDTANQYAPITKLEAKGKFHKGAFSVHDYLSSTVEQVMDYEKEFKRTFKNLASNFDVHHQVLLSLAAYVDGIENTQEYKRLLNKAENRLAGRKELMKRFNDDTNSLIGEKKGFTDIISKLDVDLYEELNNIKRTKKVDKPSKNFSKQPKANTKDKKEIKSLLENLAKDSDIISSYLKSANKANIVFGEEYSFGSATNTISIDKNNKGLKENIEHEIVHSFTTGYIQNQLDKGKNSSIRYLEKTLKVLSSKSLEGEVKDRVDYILSKNTKKEQLAELVAVLSTESVATDVYGVLSEGNSSKLKKVIKAIKKAVKSLITNITESDVYAEGVDIELLQGAINNVVMLGQNNRENDFKLFREGQIKFGKNLNFNVKNRNKLNYLNHALASMVNHKLENAAVRTIKNTHRKFKRFPLYEEVSNKIAGIYDNEDLQQLVHTISNKNIDVLKKNKYLSDSAIIRGDKNDFITNELTKFKKITKGLSKEDIKSIKDFTHKVPLHDYFILADNLKTKEAISNEIDNLESTLSKDIIADIDGIISLNVDNKITGDIYNLDARYSLDSDTEFSLSIRKYLALKSIDTLGSDRLLSILKNKDLAEPLKDLVVANKLSTLENETAFGSRDSLVEDHYDKVVDKRAVTLKTVNNFKEDHGWKVVKQPTKDELGIVYRDVVDFTNLEGAFTDVSAVSNDIDVNESMSNYTNVVKTNKGYKVIVQDADKELMGVTSNPFESIIRSTAKNLAIQDSQILRDTFVKSERFMLNTKEDETSLVDKIETTNIDNPWFIKTDKPYNTLDSKIRSKYKLVKKASNVKGFNNEVTLVRKDIAHWLVGDYRNSYIQNPTLKHAIKITKELVAGAKVGMVVLNPMKIVRDNLSNINYLGVSGVDPIFTAKTYSSLSKEYKEYTNLQENLVELKLKYVANPTDDRLKKKYDKLKYKMEGLKIHGAFKRGFVNSLGSHLVSNNEESLHGLGETMSKGFKLLLKDKRNKNNVLSDFIKKLSNAGGNGEVVLKVLSERLSTLDTTEAVSKELDKLYRTIKETKTEEDSINYLLQFTTSSSSGAVKFGAAITDISDLMAKETMFRYLTEKEGLTKKEAETEVIESFPDYKENMPMTVKQLSDLGIIMFPSFWMNIQKPIYRMIRDKPVSFGIETSIEYFLDMNLESIFDANLLNKIDSYGGLFHTPNGSIGIGSFVPVNVF